MPGVKDGQLDASKCSVRVDQMGQEGGGGGREHHPAGAGDEGGRDARVKDCGVVHRLAQTFTDRLRHPTRLCQVTEEKETRRACPIAHHTIFEERANCSISGAAFCTKWGALGY